MRRILILWIAFLLVLNISAPVNADSSTSITNSDGFVYTVKDDGTAEIVGYTGNEKELYVPSQLDGYPVTSLGTLALSALSLRKIELPGTLRVIGSQALAFNNPLTEVVIPEGVEELGFGILWDCQKLKTVTIPDSVTKVGDAIIGGTSKPINVIFSENSQVLEMIDGVLFSKTDRRLIWYPSSRKGKEYIVPDGTKMIGTWVFQPGTKLERIILPESVEKIGMEAFAGLTKLRRINVPSKVTNLETVFVTLDALEQIDIPECHPVYESIDGIIFQKETHTLTYYPVGKKSKKYEIPEGTVRIGPDAFNHAKFTEVIFPTSVKKIGDTAFGRCGSLKNVVLNEGLEEIGFHAFVSCTALSSVTIPNTVTKIDTNPFLFCDKLKTVKLQEGQTHFAIIDEALVDTDSKRLLWFPLVSKRKTYQIPDGVEIIGDQSFAAFISGPQLNEIIIPEGVTAIESWAFQNHSKIKRFVLPSSLRTIALDAFDATLNDVKKYIGAVYVVKKGSYAEEYCLALNLNIEYSED